MYHHDIFTLVMSQYHNILTYGFRNQTYQLLETINWFPQQLNLEIIAWSHLAIIAIIACLYWLPLFFKQRCANDLTLKILILVWEGMDQDVVVMLESKESTKLRLRYFCNCDIIAIPKVMWYDNCSSTLLQYCNDIELLPALSNRKSHRGIYIQK